MSPPRASKRRSQSMSGRNQDRRTYFDPPKSDEPDRRLDRDTQQRINPQKRIPNRPRITRITRMARIKQNTEKPIARHRAGDWLFVSHLSVIHAYPWNLRFLLPNLG